MMALKAGELPGPQGQIELFRQYALGNFRNLLIEVALLVVLPIALGGASWLPTGVDLVGLTGGALASVEPVTAA